MAKKIAIASKIGVSVKGVFEDFVVAQTAKGYTEKTIANYRSHFKSISRHIDLDCAFSALTKADIRPQISDRLRGRCVYASKTAGTLHAENDEALL